MRTRNAIKVLLLLAAASPAADARAGSLVLRAGASYWRSDTWSEGTPRSTAPHLDLDLGLNARGVVVSSDWVSYLVDAQLRRITDERDGVETGSTQTVTYAANANILSNGVSPVALNVFATRSEVDFAADPAQDVHGTGLTNVYGANMTLSLFNKPSVTASYSRLDTEQHIPEQERFESKVESVGTSLGFGTTAFQAQASYSGTFQDSVWDADDSASHDVSVSAWVPVGSSTLSVESLSAFSIPDHPEVVGTAEQQTSHFRATWTNDGDPGRRHSVTYGYGHALRESPGTPTAELNRQSVSYAGDLRLVESSLFTRWHVDASVAEARSDATALGGAATESRSTGETLGVDLWWRSYDGATAYELRAGPRVGLLQTEEQNTTGFGATARALARHPLWGHSVSVDWSGSYSTQLFATAGWQFSHSLSASLSGRARSTSFELTARGSSFRTSSPVTGAGSGRRLEATSRARMTRLQLDARVGLQSGMVGATPDQFVGDGLILPAPFNSNVFDASAGASYKLYWGFTGSVRARYKSSEIPGRPDLRQAEGIVALSYQYGAFGLSVEDRYSRYEAAGGGWNSGNLIMVRAYRMLSW